MDQVQIIERSIHCYHAGWWSLVPIAGLVPAVFAFYQYARVRSDSSRIWNPAGAYLRSGLALALIGFVLTFFLLAAPLASVIF